MFIMTIMTIKTIIIIAIDGKNFSDIPMKNKEGRYEKKLEKIMITQQVIHWIMSTF